MTRLRWQVAAVILAVALLLLVLLAKKALAHDWYNSTSDPVFQSSCCGGHDCAPVNPEWVSIEGDGYRLSMTLEQARTVNPSTQKPVDAFIPGNRVQSPPNGNHAFYACIYDSDRARPREGVICFFATPDDVRSHDPDDRHAGRDLQIAAADEQYCFRRHRA